MISTINDKGILLNCLPTVCVGEGKWREQDSFAFLGPKKN